jgi:hypothetical protein
MKPSSWGLAVVVLGISGAGAWGQTGAPQSRGSAAVYRCPGPPVLYTDTLSPQEAKEKGCRLIEAAPVTVMQSPKPRPVSSARPAEGRVDPADQKARDSDAKQILEAELRKEEERLTTMQKEYNNGEPERLGDERNYAKYQERVATLKANIERKEADIAALKRELAKYQ